MVLRGRLEIITCRIETIGLTSLFLKEICDIKIVNMLKEVIPLGVFFLFFFFINTGSWFCLLLLFWYSGRSRQPLHKRRKDHQSDYNQKPELPHSHHLRSTGNSSEILDKLLLFIYYYCWKCINLTGLCICLLLLFWLVYIGTMYIGRSKQPLHKRRKSHHSDYNQKQDLPLKGHRRYFIKR